MVVIASGEQGFAGEHLGKDAPNGPDVDGFGILLEGEHDLGSTVPAGRHVFL